MAIIEAHILSLLIFLPLVAALGAALSPSTAVARGVALIGSVITFAGSLFLWWRFDGTSAALQFVERYEWIPDLGVTYFVGVDGISLLLVVLTGFLTPLIIISQWNATERQHTYFFALMMALESAMFGALLAMDLVFFYVFWEAMLIPMYFIIGIWGGRRRIYATTKFVIYTVAGSLLMLVAAIVLYLVHYHQYQEWSTAIPRLYGLALGDGLEMWLFLAFAVAFAIKVPLWPFHTWLPDAHVEAPTTGSVVLAGVLLKMGTYGLLRFAIPMFPQAVAVCAPWLVALGVVGIIYGALVAWVQGDAKKLVAYSSVSHLGFVVIGSLAIMQGDGFNLVLSKEALTGAVYQMVNHGISTGALFFLVGVIYERRHSRQLDDFGGLAAQMPWFAIFLIVATLSSVGLPGTGGFVGEFLILLGVFQAEPIVGITAGLGVLLGAIYMLTLCRRILFGPLDKQENRELKDLNSVEFCYLTPLVVLAIVMGVFPGVFIDKLRPSIDHLAENFQSYHLVAESRVEHGESSEGDQVVLRGDQL